MEFLVIEDNLNDYFLLEAYLLKNGCTKESLYHADSLGAIPSDTGGDLAVIFLDLYLPDSTGLETFKEVMRLFPHIPIIVLSGVSDTEVALRAIQCGAQDYLIKGEFNEKTLFKSLSYSRERKRIQETLRASNERYEFLARVSGEAIWELNRWEGKIYCWNSGYETLFGYHNAANMHWRWWYRKLHAADRADLAGRLREVYRASKTSVSFECRLRSAGGSFHYVLMKIYIVYEQRRMVRIIGSVQDIDEMKVMQRHLTLRQLHHQREIIKNTIEVQERERRKLGRELHDNINQTLASCRMCIDSAVKHKEQAEEILPIVYKNLGMALEEIRMLSRDLVAPSLGETGFKEAVENLVFPMTIGHDVRFRMRINLVDEPEEIKLMLYRIVQEQLHNIMKYANASVVFIRIERILRDIQVEITDNGVGFDPGEKAEGIGLKNIRYRAEYYRGSFAIESAPNRGCKLFITIPLPKD